MCGGVSRASVAVAEPGVSGIAIASGIRSGGHMSPIKKILVPVDFSESSIKAARGAMAWADRFGSELSLLHVVPDPIHGRVSTELAEFSPKMLVDQWTRGTRDALEALAVRLSTSHDRVRTAVRLGGPAAEIMAYASEQQVDLIAMASRGQGPVGRMLLGSVAEQVVRGATCPVLTIPGDVDVTRWNEDREGHVKSMVLRTVVALTDFGETSRAAVKYAYDLTIHFGATLHVLHVVAPSWERQLAYVPPPPERTEELRWRAERWLMRWVEHFKDPASIVTASRLGKPSEGAVAHADEVGADLMVMATHGREGLERLVLGSVAQGVLRHAHCPVLTMSQAWHEASEAAAPMTSGDGASA